MEEDFDKTENSKFIILKKKTLTKQTRTNISLSLRKRFQSLLNEEELNDDCSNISNNDKNNNDNNHKTVNDEDNLDEALQQEESSSTKASASFKKKEHSTRPRNVAILDD